MFYKITIFIALILLNSCDELSQLTLDLSDLTKEGITQNPVALLQNNGGYCVATLLENGHVLTAGHCITSTRLTSRMKLRFQNPNNPNFKIVPIKNIIKKVTASEDEQIHPITRNNIHTTRDFALLEVENPEELKKNFHLFLSQTKTIEKSTHSSIQTKILTDAFGSTKKLMKLHSL